MIPGSANPLLFRSSNINESSYSIANSLRFRGSNSGYLAKGYGTSGVTSTWTFSAWVKRTTTGVWSPIFSARDVGAYYQQSFFGFNNSDQLIYYQFSNQTGYTVNVTSTSVYRDLSSWYHVVLQFDAGTSSLKGWVNNQLVIDSTSFSTTYRLINLATTHFLMAYGDNSNVYTTDGYLAEVYFLDGRAETASSFGQTSSLSGSWVPKRYGFPGYVNDGNGFYLNFQNASSTTTIGYDSGGRSNHFTSSGISVTSGVTFDQMTDTPTLNYAVMNPLDLSGTAATFQWANMRVTRSGASFAQAYCSIQMSSGKWYCEMTAGADVTNLALGLITGTTNAAANRYLGQDSFTYGYDPDGRKVNNASYSLYGNSWTAGDIIGIILDADNGKLYFSKNGTVQNSGDPVAGTNAAFTGLTGPYRFAAAFENGGIGDFNFGQRAFSYTPPSGFKALNTANLPTPSIKKGSLYMDATTRTGTGATASVSSLGFQPDLVWIKSRSAATDHGLYDAVRGVQKQLESNTTTAETTEATGLTAFSSNGYTVGALAQLNTSAATYVDWAWKEGVTPGFDIVTYVGTGSALNVSHNLGVAPRFLVIKARNNTVADHWGVYHGSLLNTQNLYLNQTSAVATAGMWNSTTPTSSVFTVGANNDVNRSGISYVGYVWSEIEGFSKISSYTGNGSTDGPFVWCGFRPRYVLIKSTGTENWSVQDSARNPYNVVNARLKPNSADAEAVSSVQNVDFLSNGFKIRTTDPEKNGSGTTYIFAAFAENPFKYARAR